MNYIAYDLIACDKRDPGILSILLEMTSETAAGRMYVETKTDRRRTPTASQRRRSPSSKRPDPELPLIGVKRPEIRFLHENSKSVPAGSNPSKRHGAGPGIIARQTKSLPRAVQPQASLAAVDRMLRASQRRE